MPVVYFAVMLQNAPPTDEGTSLTASKQWEPTGTQFFLILLREETIGPCPCPRWGLPGV